MKTKTKVNTNPCECKEETNTFAIQVIISDCYKKQQSNKIEKKNFKWQSNKADKTLFIKLIDYNDWTLYEKEYTQENRGKQIHLKMDFYDICSVFSQKLLKNDEDQQKLLKLPKNDEDQQRENEKNSYKIYTFGTVVKNENGPLYKIDRNGQVTVYHNVINLTANKEVPQTYQSVLKLSKVRELSQLEICRIKYDLQIKFTNGVVMKRIQKLEKENSSLKQAVVKLLQYLNKNKKWVDLTSPYYNNFKLNGNSIRYISTNNKWTQVLSNEVIPQNRVYTFSINITYTQNKHILIGVLDRQTAKNNQSSFRVRNAISYYIYDGYIYPDYGVKGGGAIQGQTLEVVVDLAKGSIQFKVAGTVRGSITGNTVLLDKNRQFVPYIQIHNTNDHVEWLGSSESYNQINLKL